MSKPVNDNDWFEIVIRTPAAHEDALLNFLNELGSVGQIIEDGGDDHRIVSYFVQKDSERVSGPIGEYVDALSALFPDSAPSMAHMGPIETENWAVMWKDNFHPIEIGARLVILPPWEKAPNPGRIEVLIEPGPAFGTGSHESTRGCLLMLDALPDWEDKPRTILDIGSGSGILAIVAAKLCDAEITAIDIDCAALESAKENAALNGRADRIAFICRSVEEQDSLFDLVIANLDYRTFMALGASTARLTAARLIVAGLTCAQWPEIRDMFASLGLRPVSEAQLGDWKSGMFHRIA